MQEDERGSAGDQEEEDDGDDGGDDDGDDHAPFSSCLGSHLSAMDSSSPSQLLLAIDSGAHSSLPPTRSSRQLPPSQGLLPSKGKLLHSLQDPGYSKSSAPKALGSKAQRFSQDETEKE